MKCTAFSKVILGLLLVSSGGALFASDIDELRERAKPMQTKAALLAEHPPEFRAQIEKLERAGRRLHHLRVAAVHLKLAEEHDLAHKLMEKAEDIERDVHVAKLRLAAEMHANSEHHEAGSPNLVAKLKEENERLRAELRELKQYADKRQ